MIKQFVQEIWQVLRLQQESQSHKCKPFCLDRENEGVMVPGIPSVEHGNCTCDCDSLLYCVLAPCEQCCVLQRKFWKESHHTCSFHIQRCQWSYLERVGTEEYYYQYLLMGFGRLLKRETYERQEKGEGWDLIYNESTLGHIKNRSSGDHWMFASLFNNIYSIKSYH